MLEPNVEFEAASLLFPNNPPLNKLLFALFVVEDPNNPHSHYYYFYKPPDGVVL